MILSKKNVYILFLDVQFALLLQLFPVNLASNEDKPYFTVMKTRDSRHDSGLPADPNLSSPGHFQNLYLEYKPEPS